jgi:hypothetical protein
MLFFKYEVLIYVSSIEEVVYVMYIEPPVDIH